MGLSEKNGCQVVDLSASGVAFSWLVKNREGRDNATDCKSTMMIAAI